MIGQSCSGAQSCVFFFSSLPTTPPPPGRFADRPHHELLATSDLGYNYTAEAIFGNLAACWDVAQAHGSKVLVLTVPEVGVRGGAAMQRIHGQRDELNRLIRNAQGGNMFGPPCSPCVCCS